MVRGVAYAVLLAAPLETMAAKSQAFVFRHCLRMSADEAKYAKPEFPFLHSYTAYPLPEWGVPENWCTEGGMKTAQAAGADLMAHFGVDPAKMSITADISMRDGDTAVAMITGMKAACPVEYDPILYSPIDPEAGEPVCAEPDAATNAADVHARFAEVPLPWDLEAAIDEFESVFGVGPAGSLRDLGNVSVSVDGKVSGPVVVMKKLSQNLLYSRASGIEYLNDTATDKQMTRFYGWQAYYRSVKDVGSKKAVESSYLLSRVFDDLFEKKDHSTLHFGHDGNMNGFNAYFDLEWEAAPFLGGKLVPTPPTSAIRFVYDDVEDAVTASFVYLPFDKLLEGAAFLESPVKTWAKGDFLKLAYQNLGRYGAAECFNQAPKSQGLTDMLSTFASYSVSV